MSELPQWVQVAACYLRRSREDLAAERRGENTLLAQRDLMVGEVLPRYPVQYEIYEEVASGDTIKDRPVFQKLLAALEQGQYQAVAVKDLTRLGRGSYTDMGRVYDLVRDRRIFIIHSTSVLDPANPDDLRNIRFSMFLSREEYEATVFRLVQGKYNQVRHRGRWVAGVTPYGYDYHRDTRKLVPNSDADTVRLIYNLFVEGDSGPLAIARRLRQFGVNSPAGKQNWSPQTIRRILANPVYKGTISYKRTKRRKSDGKVVPRPMEERIVVDHAHPAIVAEEKWELVQQNLRRTAPKTPLKLTPTELAGVVTCGACGKKMLRQSSRQVYRRKNGDVSTYEREFLACIPCGYWVQYRFVEQQLLSLLQQFTLSQKQLLVHFERLGRGADPSSVTKVGALQNLQKRRQLISRRLMKNRDGFLDGTFTKVEFEADRKRHHRELTMVNEAIATLERQLARPSEVIPVNYEGFLTGVKSAYQAYQTLTSKARKNALLRDVFPHVELAFLGRQGRRNRFALKVVLAYDNLL